MSNGLSAMGYGVPAAIAAQIHFPDRPVVSVVGDGGMLMMLHNLVVLRQYRLPVVIVCFVDGSLSLIRVAQERRGVEPYGVDFPAPDFSAIAEAYGVRGIRVTTIDELKRTMEDALAARAPAVVHVPVDIREYHAYC
jgi:acetolactate synthase-1/2/3 large subunit